jgi:hypothetical protein
MAPATTSRLEQLAMRAKAGDAQEGVAYLAVNQQQVGPDVAFAIARPFAGERVIAHPVIQVHIGGERFEDRGKLNVERPAMPSSALALVVATKDRRQFNRPRR